MNLFISFVLPNSYSYVANKTIIMCPTRGLFSIFYFMWTVVVPGFRVYATHTHTHHRVYIYIYFVSGQFRSRGPPER